VDFARIERIAHQRTWDEETIEKHKRAIEDALLALVQTKEGILLLELLEDTHLYRVSKDQFEEGQRSVLLGLYSMIASALRRQADEEAQASGLKPLTQTHAVTQEGTSNG
jgi:uncharacterized protein YjgD (DUF1641 family)